MLLYDADSPAPRCLRMFLKEKNLCLPTVAIDVFKGENRLSPYLSINPAGQTPALQLDDGRVFAEAVSIAEYLEKRYPSPVLIGENAAQRLETRQWWRRIEMNVTEFIHNAYHYAEGLPRFCERIPVAPEAANGLKRIATDRLRWLDGMMKNSPYLCGDRFTVADIWLYVWLDFGNQVNQVFDHDLPWVGPWFQRVAERPSAEPSRLVGSASC